jgi:Fe-S cluster assembly scaffold protein SufB
MEKIFDGREVFPGFGVCESVNVATDSKIIITNFNGTTDFAISAGVTLDVTALVMDCAGCGIHMNFFLGKMSRLRCLILAEGCSNVNATVTSSLNGEYSSSTVVNFFHGERFDEQTFSVTQTHNAANARSLAVSKTILDGHAHSEFLGSVNISEIADNSDACQRNDNILFSEFARATSLPALNILNNNVKCSHGATVGAIDDSVIFYMMNRGIDLRACKSLITDGIVWDLISGKTT